MEYPIGISHKAKVITSCWPPLAYIKAINSISGDPCARLCTRNSLIGKDGLAAVERGGKENIEARVRRVTAGIIPCNAYHPLVIDSHGWYPLFGLFIHVVTDPKRG